MDDQIQEDSGTFSLEDVLAEHLAVRGLTVDAPVVYCYEARKADLHARTAPVQSYL